MNFNLAEKLAIVKAIDEVILADGQVKKGEIKFATQLMRIIKFDRALVQEARSLDAKEGLAILKSMPNNKKHALALILNEMANADGKFDDSEVRLICSIFAGAGIDVDTTFR